MMSNESGLLSSRCIKRQDLTRHLNTYGIVYLLAVYLIISGLCIAFFNGTGDAGDSVYHYLFAKYAPVHTELYFDHWAKPLYVLLASPFAQFGFTGVKIFNVIVSCGSIYFIYKTAAHLKLKNALLAAVFFIFAPLCFALTFSGLTEPLFGFFLSLGIYLILKNNLIWACIVLSFLPFIRSEGLIMLLAIGLYLMLKKDWKSLPWLLFGSILYSIAGAFVYHDLLWVFTKIPYASTTSPYGSGEWYHFIEQLLYVIGIPLYLLFWLGCLAIIWHSMKKKSTLEIQVLILLGALGFIAAHSLFWYFGIFNSMGLKRVLIAILPLISIIGLMGYNLITEELLVKQNKVKHGVQILLLAYLFIFPFTSNPAALDWDRDFKLNRDQEMALEVGAYIKSNFGMDHRFVFNHPYLSEVLDVDFFDPDKRRGFGCKDLDLLESGDLIIWENWFYPVELGLEKECLDHRIGLHEVFTLSDDTRGRMIEYVVYIKE